MAEHAHLDNAGIVVVDSSAFGPTGPWAKRLGYGPLVRAAAGFTDLWVYPGDANPSPSLRSGRGRRTEGGPLSSPIARARSSEPNYAKVSLWGRDRERGVLRRSKGLGA